MVGIELRRAGCRWRVTNPALSIASWVLISTMAAFSKAPPIMPDGQMDGMGAQADRFDPLVESSSS